jgi:hypothetical protein
MYSCTQPLAALAKPSRKYTIRMLRRSKVSKATWFPIPSKVLGSILCIFTRWSLLSLLASIVRRREAYDSFASLTSTEPLSDSCKEHSWVTSAASLSES